MDPEINEEELQQHIACLVHDRVPYTYTVSYSTIQLEERIAKNKILMHTTYQAQFIDAYDQTKLIFDVIYSSDPYFDKNIADAKTYSNRITVKRLEPCDYAALTTLRNGFFEKKLKLKEKLEL